MNENALLIIIPAAMISTAVVTYLLTKWNSNQIIDELKRQYEDAQIAFNAGYEEARRIGHRDAMQEARALMQRQEKDMRADSVKRSKFVTLGKIAEQFAPYLPGWRYNPNDARFLGSPLDFIVFDGMSDGVINEVVFIEIKTGNAQLSSREQDLQDIICLKKVRYETIRIPLK